MGEDVGGSPARAGIDPSSTPMNFAVQLAGSPARAGIDLAPGRLGVDYFRFPRTRGDRPARAPIPSTAAPLSPRKQRVFRIGPEPSRARSGEANP